MNLLPRVREMIRVRGWVEDDDLIACMVMALVCVAEGSPATKLKRPAAVDATWPRECPTMKAGRVIHVMGLVELLEV